MKTAPAPFQTCRCLCEECLSDQVQSILELGRSKAMSDKIGYRRVPSPPFSVPFLHGDLYGDLKLVPFNTPET